MSPKEEMLKAITEMLTLACLQEEASFNYYISNCINERTDGAIHITASFIIPQLYRLLEHGRIRETTRVIHGRERTCYVLTPAGEARLSELIDAYLDTHQAFWTFLENQKKALSAKDAQPSEPT